MSSGYTIAGLVGIGIALQVALVGRASDNAHPLAISLALQLSGVAAAAAWATSSGSWSDVAAVTRLWWWIPLGIGGWVVVAALGFASSQVGVAAVLAVSVATQLISGLALDAATGTSLVGSRSFLGVAMILSGLVVLTTPS